MERTNERSQPPCHLRPTRTWNMTRASAIPNQRKMEWGNGVPQRTSPPQPNRKARGLLGMVVACDSDRVIIRQNTSGRVQRKGSDTRGAQAGTTGAQLGTTMTVHHDRWSAVPGPFLLLQQQRSAKECMRML